MGYKSFISIASVVSIIVVLIACGKKEGTVGSNPGDPQLPATPYNYIGVNEKIPFYMKEYLRRYNTGLDNANGRLPTNEIATLGRVLFYDKSLSVNNSISCGSCHRQEYAFSDGVAFSKGFSGTVTSRNTQGLANARFFPGQRFFWDFRSTGIEEASLNSILDPMKMGMPSVDAMVERLKTKVYYRILFRQAYGESEGISEYTVGEALRQFIRSIVSFETKYDSSFLRVRGLTDSEEKGLSAFKRLRCDQCHSNGKKPAIMFPGAFFTGENTGMGSNNGLDAVYVDKGIGGITGLAKDFGTFKMPNLRNVELTAPYMHDGRFSSLEEVLNFYQKGVKANPNLGFFIRPEGYASEMSDEDKSNIIAFLKTLTDKRLITDVRYSDPFK